MARHPMPIERQADQARGDGLRPGGHKPTEVVEYQPYNPATIPEMPSDLKARGQKEWIKIWESGPWLHPQEDYRWVEIIARSYDDITIFRKQVAQDGLVIKGYANQSVAHPLIAEIRSKEQQIMKCLSVLGFSPSDRARLGLAEIKRQSGLADLQSKTRAADKK